MGNVYCFKPSEIAFSGAIFAHKFRIGVLLFALVAVFSVVSDLFVLCFIELVLGDEVVIAIIIDKRALYMAPRLRLGNTRFSVSCTSQKEGVIKLACIWVRSVDLTEHHHARARKRHQHIIKLRLWVEDLIFKTCESCCPLFFGHSRRMVFVCIFSSKGCGRTHKPHSAES